MRPGRGGEPVGDGTTISAFLSYHHADDRPVRRLQREIADLGDLRDHLASEATGVLVLVDTSALSTPNLNRFVRESITCGCLQDLVDTGGAAPTFTPGAVAGPPTGGGGPALTGNAPSGPPGYAL